MLDFHVAHNDGSVKGWGTHDATGRHRLATDPNGKLNIARDAGDWWRDAVGHVILRVRCICWDGCMFPNDVNAATGNLERHPAADVTGSRKPRLAGVRSPTLNSFCCGKGVIVILRASEGSGRPQIRGTIFRLALEHDPTAIQ